MTYPTDTDPIGSIAPQSDAVEGPPGTWTGGTVDSAAAVIEPLRLGGLDIMAYLGLSGDAASPTGNVTQVLKALRLLAATATAAVASAATVTLPTTGAFITVTGTTTITDIALPVSPLTTRLVVLRVASGPITLQHGAHLHLGVDVTLDTDQTLALFSDGTAWYPVGAASSPGGLPFAGPALTLGTTNADGVAATAIRSDATLAVFDAIAPTTQAMGDSANVGTVSKAARRDHAHGLPAFGTSAGTVAQGNDSRLSDARTPTIHGATHVSLAGDPIPTFTTSTRGLVAPPGGTPSGTKYLNDLGVFVDPALTSGGMSDPMTAEDDLIVGDVPVSGVAAPKRLVKGTDGQFLGVDPADHHVKYRTLPTFGVGQDGIVTGPGAVVAGQFLASSGAWATPSGGMTNPMTTQDDLIVGGSSGTPGRLAKGADGQVLTVDPATHHLVWANSASGFSNPMTTTGDLIKGGASGVAARLAIGSTGDVLTVAGGAPVWAAPSGGGGSSGSLLWDPTGVAVPPVAADLSVHDHWALSGFVTALTQYGNVAVFKNPAAAATIERGAFGTTSGPYAVPTPPYTVTLCMLPNFAQGNSWSILLSLRNSSTDKRVSLKFGRNSGMEIQEIDWTDFQTLSTASGAVPWYQGVPVWLRIRDNAANQFFEYSKDGDTWNLHASRATGFFTAPDQAGVTSETFGAVSGSQGAVTILSLSVVNTA